MKEVRPSTWVLLGVLALFIFAPLFFIDIEGLQQTLDQPGDNTIQPTQTIQPTKPGENKAPEGNTPPENKPPEPPANRPPGEAD